MPSLEDALQYTNAGISIVIVYPVRDGICGCAKGAACTNIGKHPIGGPDMCEHGAFSGSKDPDVIARWWERWPDANIGIPLGDLNDKIYVQDVDNSEIAQALVKLFLSDDAPPGFAVATTGREGGGCHVWIQSSKSEPHGHVLNTSFNDRIGEFRGTGSYVVAPPSIHATGRQYAFIYGNPSQTPLQVVGDPLAAVLGLLKRVGVTVAPTQKKVDLGDIPEIGAIEVPFNTDGLPVLNQLLSGTFPQRDKSLTLLKLGFELWRGARLKSFIITPEQVAGVIKQLDTAVYQKFSQRKDADKYYWQKAMETQVREQEEFSKGRGGPSRVVGEARYAYSDQGGLEYLGGRSGSIRLANFKPEIIQETQIIGEDLEHPNHEYVMRLSVPDEEIDIFLSDRATHSDITFRREMMAQVSRKYLVEPDCWWRIYLAANELSTNVLQVRHYGRPGWYKIDGTYAFILPTSEGGITATGVQPELTFHGFSRSVPQRYNLYGAGVYPIRTKEERDLASSALKVLLELAPPEVLLPALLGVLGAPLMSLGLSDAPPLLHFFGETGAYKTSSMLACMSLFGQFSRGSKSAGSKVTESWTSTIASLQHALHLLRDLPVLIDDFKLVNVKISDVAKLVQNYGDGTTRSRMSSEQERRSSLTPTGLFISTGEDQWEEEKSVYARTLSIPFPKGCVNFDNLVLCQRYGAGGILGRIGASYLQFIANIDPEQLHELIEKFRVEARASMLEKIHPRVMDTVSSVLAVERIASAFIKKVFPEHADQFQDIRAQNWSIMSDRMQAQAKEAEQLTPIRQVLESIRMGMDSGLVRLNKRRSDEYMGSMVGRCVGFYDEHGLYLTKTVTMQWFEETISHRRGDKNFTWNAVKRDARESAHGQDKTLWETGNINALFVPKAEVVYIYETYSLDQYEVIN